MQQEEELAKEIETIEKDYEELFGVKRLPAITRGLRPVTSLTPRIVQSYTTYGGYEKPI